MKRILVRSWSVALAISVVLASIASSAFAATPIPVISNDLDPVVPEYQILFAEHLAEMPRYRMDLALDETMSTIGGSLLVTFPNETGSDLDVLPFRLYPNAWYYDEGALDIHRVVVDGIEIIPRFDESETVLFVDLPRSLTSEESVTVLLDFTTVIPRNASGSFGILNHDLNTQRFVLADWYPIIAGWDETGWRLEPPTEQGDPTFSMTSLYDVQLTLPADYTVIAPGTVSHPSDGVARIISGPAREFALVATRGMETISELARETSVSVHLSPDDRAAGRHVLDFALAALDFYDDAFGAYPYRQFDIVATDLALAYGVSWAGMIWIDEGLLASTTDTAALDFTIFHEIGHQWWGAVVGANSNDHTFMVEGLTNATALLAQAAVQGSQAAANSLYAWMVAPYSNLLAGTGDGVVDVPIFDQPAASPLSTLAYGKGGLGFLAIRNQIGDAAFRAALAAYAARFRLGIAEPGDLLSAFENASGQSLRDLWAFWFESAETTPADVDELVSEIVVSLD